MGLEKDHIYLYRIPTLIRKALLTLPYLALLVILLLAIIAPILEYQRLEVSRTLYDTTHNICNQLPTRCLWILTSPMGLCARCFGIYLTMLATGIFLIRFGSKHIYWKSAVLLMIPCIIDGSTQYLGHRLSNNGLRLITGSLAGIGMGLFFFPLYHRFIDFITKRR